MSFENPQDTFVATTPVADTSAGGWAQGTGEPAAPAVPAATSAPAAPVAAGVDARRLHLLRDVELGITVELGRTRMKVQEVLGLAPGMVVELDRTAGSPVDVLVNGTLM